MLSTSMARKAGIVGMIGTGLWIISAIMQSIFNLYSQADRSPLLMVHEVIVIVALVGIVIGVLGLIWGGAVKGAFGKISVAIYALSWTLIIIVAITGLWTNYENSPIDLLAPIGGLLHDVGGLLIGITVITARRWTGWQRFMPLVNFLVVFLGINLPVALNRTDGPGLIGQLIMGVCWMGLFLAEFTMGGEDRVSILTPQTSRQS